ncbi:MotA/TolQ/ExbB proton channel family protein [Kiritimatiellota bacterium B12222]|nr:MotA/TolQ/ExbB proton channel family protein [Kiritimatiellota bacterium B12222]
MSPKHKWTWGLILGCLLATGPIWGLVGTIIGMIRTFASVAQTGSAEATASGINTALYTTAAGVVLCPFGIALIIVSSIKRSNACKQDALTASESL